jgi:hypothetical protein
MPAPSFPSTIGLGAVGQFRLGKGEVGEMRLVVGMFHELAYLTALVRFAYELIAGEFLGPTANSAHTIECGRAIFRWRGRRRRHGEPAV